MNNGLREMVRSQLERDLRRLEDDLAIQQMSENRCLIKKEISYLKEL